MSKEMLEGSKILLVEDEETLAIGLQYNLTEEGCIVSWVKDGKVALEKLSSQDYDLIILDIMLPYVNGFEVTQYIREKNPQLPILMLTAMTRIEDRVKGLELGADDYVTKPFHLDELILRVRGMLKRKMWYKSATDFQPVYCFGNIEIDFEKLICTREKNTIRLTPHEAMALKYLIQNKGKIVSRKDLLENVWSIKAPLQNFLHFYYSYMR